MDKLKNRFTELTGKFRKNVSSGDLTGRIRKVDATQAVGWMTGAIRGGDASFYGYVVTVIACAYFLADVSAIGLGKLLPEAPSRPRAAYGMHHSAILDDYNTIFARNLFNSNGVIPGEDVGSPQIQDMGGPPVKTSLPFTLVGTMIMEDELRSIATIEDSTAQAVYPVREEDEIPSKAKILKIEPRRVIFLNEENHHREYVDLPANIEIKGPEINLGNSTPGIQQVAPTQFDISRSEVDSALANLNNILTQARAVPNFENGQPAGYKLFQIVPGSIYSKLGLVDGDVICGFDGQPANDPAAAFEKLSNIRNTSHLDLCVKRGGRQMSYSYDFK